MDDNDWRVDIFTGYEHMVDKMWTCGFGCVDVGVMNISTVFEEDEDI